MALGIHSFTITSRPGALYGNGRRMEASTTLKIAVLAPMPSAKVRIATAVNAGLLRSMRKAWRRSWGKRAICALPPIAGRLITEQFAGPDGRLQGHQTTGKAAL